jgi:glucose/arabinose dehydrogenase
MRVRFGSILFCLFFLLVAIHGGCGGGTPETNTPTPSPTPSPTGPVALAFTPVGGAIDDLLIDLEFLPGQDGEAIAITQDGSVYYLRNDFTPLTDVESIAVTFVGDERGLLNVAADPLYGTSNNFVYFYYTVAGISPDINRVTQYEVDVDVGGGSFSLNNPQTIIEFQKSGTADNHNGGSMVFITQDELVLGVGEGAVAANAQTLANGLGKIHRIIPRRPGPGFNVPSDNPFVGTAGAQESIFSLGVRNPFTLVFAADRGLLIMGDVGENLFEEINLVNRGGNYGWPSCEGPCDPPNPSFTDPVHGYFHSNATFYDEDPLPNNEGPKSIMVSAIYQGDQYGGALTDKLIYNEFFGSWIRLATLGPGGVVVADQHIGHLEGLTGLHTHPVDGFLYGVSLGGSEQVLRVDLAP